MKIFINTKLANQKPLPPIPISSFSLTDVETALSAEVDKLVEDEDYKVYQRVISLKPSVAYVKRTIHHLADFDEITSQTIKAILEGLTTQYPKDVIEAVFKYKISCETYKSRKKVAPPDIAPIDSTPSRRHRTSRLQEQSDIRHEFIYLAGTY